MRRMDRTLCLLLAALLLLLMLGGCSASRGRTVRYDGYTVRTEKTRSEAEEANEETPARSPDRGEAAEDYVLNSSSRRFHYPDCSGVKDIKEQNRVDYHGTRSDVIDMGYTPCRICNP